MAHALSIHTVTIDTVHTALIEPRLFISNNVAF